MLSPDHVRAKRDGERLVLLQLSPKKRRRAHEIAEELLIRATSALGNPRDSVERVLAEVELAPSERRIADGLRKLLLDHAVFEQTTALEPCSLRRDVFLRASALRSKATVEAPFDRTAVIDEVASTLNVDREVVDAGLYADLRGAHRMVRAPSLSAERLLQEYEQAQIQAVLLRAVSVVADVRCASPTAYRTLFQKLKFRNLLFRLEPLDGGGYRIALDGPFSLFEAVTKYGLELSLMLPALEACDVLDLKARVLWGKARMPLRFEHRQARGGLEAEGSHELRDEVSQLVQDFRALGSAWTCRPAEAILEVPGQGVCVPDLVFERPGKQEPVYLELLGYWSRDAVFKRVELVERGLAYKIVFALSSKLRVSEAVLEGEHAALYVFRGRPSARALLRKVEAVAGSNDSSESSPAHSH
jgi:predicted nuclease of restriction endonuclease-like RecB superfamily